MTLEQRLQAIRERGPQSVPVARNDDVAVRLRAWGGARLESAHGGRVALVERRIQLPADVAARLGGVAETRYFDTESTGLSTGAGTVIILAAVGRLDDGAIVVRQALLPDYPDEPALLRTVIGWLAGADRIVTYNGRGFDLPLLSTRMTIHGLGRMLPAIPISHDDLLPVILLRVCEQFGDFQQIRRDTCCRQDDKKKGKCEKHRTPRIHNDRIIPSFCRNSRER